LRHSGLGATMIGVRVIPLEMSGLRCGREYRNAESRSWQVIPLEMSGLRCGLPRGLVLPCDIGVIPLEMSGLRCGSHLVTDRMDPGQGHPARNERAPLRLVSYSLGPFIPEVIPLEMSGLRCGIYCHTVAPTCCQGHPARNERAPLRLTRDTKDL